MPNLNNLDESLRWLAQHGYLSGSFGRADGTGTGKDVDVMLPYGKVKKLKDMLLKQSVEWGSVFPGCITWHPSGLQVEVSDLFPRYKNGPKSVLGIEFRT